MWIIIQMVNANSTSRFCVQLYTLHMLLKIHFNSDNSKINKYRSTTEAVFLETVKKRC
jgi:hypothetical protein